MSYQLSTEGFKASRNTWRSGGEDKCLFPLQHFYSTWASTSFGGNLTCTTALRLDFTRTGMKYLQIISSNGCFIVVLASIVRTNSVKQMKPHQSRKCEDNNVLGSFRFDLAWLQSIFHVLFIYWRATQISCYSEDHLSNKRCFNKDDSVEFDSPPCWRLRSTTKEFRCLRITTFSV